jgi:hypothetical protein
VALSARALGAGSISSPPVVTVPVADSSSPAAGFSVDVAAHGEGVSAANVVSLSPLCGPAPGVVSDDEKTATFFCTGALAGGQGPVTFALTLGGARF